MAKKSKTGLDPNPIRIDWKKGTFTKQEIPPPVELDPEGYHIFVVENSIPADSEDAEWYMGKLLELTGIGPENIPDWKDGVSIITVPTPLMARRSGMDKRGENTMIPQGTLYLRINVNHWVKKMNRLDPSFIHLAKEDEVAAAIEADDEAKECAYRLVHELGVFRAWLDIKDRQFDKSRVSGPRGLTNPMSRFNAKPVLVYDHWYHVQLGLMDIAPKT